MIKTISRCIDILFVFVVCMSVLILTYVLYDTVVVANSSELEEDIAVIEPKKDDDDFNFDELKRLNSNIVGWIRIDDTNINYPVLQTDDNSYYLSRNYRDEFSVAGSIFLDYRDDILLDDFLIIYGHRMSYGKMFSDVTRYAEQGFFNDHLNGALYSEDAVFGLEAIGFETPIK